MTILNKEVADCPREMCPCYQLGGKSTHSPITHTNHVTISAKVINNKRYESIFNICINICFSIKYFKSNMHIDIN